MTTKDELVESLKAAHDEYRFPAAPCGADLRGANLYRANLSRADLIRADLYLANLSGANLYGADLRDADLRDAAHEHFMPINAGKSGKGALYPTHEGWRVSIGCWKHKTLDEWDALLADEVEWPQAKGGERDRRRPLLAAYRALADQFIAAMPADLIELHKEGRKESA